MMKSTPLITIASLNGSLRGKATEAVVLLFFSSLLVFVSSKVFTLSVRGFITIGSLEIGLFVTLAMSIFLWDIVRQMELSKWERTQDKILIDQMLVTADDEARFIWFRLIPLLDGYRKTYIHELVPTLWLLVSSAFFSLIIIREFAQISALLIGFYLFYLFILFRSVRKHIELRRAIESQITESQELAYPLIQQHLDWVVSGRFEELRRNLNALFNGYWPILSATLSNSFLPTLLLDVSWTILFIGACVWRYLYTGNAFHGDAIFFSIMVFELFKTITALNGNCFKVGETIQLRQSLKEVLERYPRFGTQAGPSRIELLEGRGITVQTPTTTIGKHPIELDIKEGDQELYFSFDRDKTATFIGLIRRQLQPTEGLLKFVPPGAKATVLDPSVSRNYLSTDSLERLRQRTLNSRDQLVVIESLLDNASTEEVITFVRFLRQEKITALVITHNKWHYENIPDFKILI
jgi:hypothetical protein